MLEDILGELEAEEETLFDIDVEIDAEGLDEIEVLIEIDGLEETLGELEAEEDSDKLGELEPKFPKARSCISVSDKARLKIAQSSIIPLRYPSAVVPPCDVAPKKTLLVGNPLSPAPVFDANKIPSK